jgi:probable HAF family extracellular repeat protein
VVKILKSLAICMIGAAFTASSIAWAHTTYTQVDYPGAVLTELVGGPNLQGTGVGVYELTTGGALHGFARTANGTFTHIDVPGATNTTPNFINLEGTIVGSYTDSAGTSHGFVLNRGNYTTVDDPGAVGTVLTGINDLGELSGFNCSDAACDASATFHSFVRSRSGTFTSFDPPGATGSEAAVVSLLGVVVGSYDTASEPTCSTQCDGYLLAHGNYTTITYPGSSFTFAGGANVWNTVVGIYVDSAGNGHGYIENGGSYTSFDYPGASFTEAAGINALGVIVGIFTDSAGNTHGFVRTP